MSFLYPLAILGLIAIPILIIIYILRNKYKETKAPTTYIWEIAAKLFKRKNPLSRFEHLLALIVQCLAIAIFSLALAHPIFTMEDAADNIVFILDSSSSMSMVHDDEVRFDKAKELISEKATEAVKGSTFTLISAEKEPRTICENVGDLSRFEMYLDSVKVTESESLLSDSIAVAQVLFSEGDCNLCYLATDQKCEETTNITVLDVSDDEDNYSITALDYKVPATKKISFSGAVNSYASNETLNLSFLVNGKEVGTGLIAAVAGEEYGFQTEEFVYSGEYINSVQAVIANEDALSKDNSFTIYSNDIVKETKVLLCSGKPTYLEAVLKAFKNVTVRIVSPVNYREAAGYDIYVFDSFVPPRLPETGTVWMFGINGPMVGSGIVYQSKMEIATGATLSFAEDDGSLMYSQLTRQLSRNRDIVVNKYQRYSLTGDFTTILTCDNVPVVFAGRNENGQRQVVFAFDLHNSNLPLLYDYVVLMRNFLDYSKPKILTDFEYEVGDTAILSIPDEVTKIVVTTPNGKTETLYWGTSEQYAYLIEQIGNYSIVATYSDGNDATIRFYSHMNEREEHPQPLAENNYVLVTTDNTVKADGLFDNILPIVIAAALFFAGDWILYTHEQY